MSQLVLRPRRDPPAGIQPVSLGHPDRDKLLVQQRLGEADGDAEVRAAEALNHSIAAVHHPS